jgi:hypothetical protein
VAIQRSVDSDSPSPKSAPNSGAPTANPPMREFAFQAEELALVLRFTDHGNGLASGTFSTDKYSIRLKGDVSLSTGEFWLRDEKNERGRCVHQRYYRATHHELLRMAEWQARRDRVRTHTIAVDLLNSPTLHGLLSFRPESSSGPSNTGCSTRSRSSATSARSSGPSTRCTNCLHH